MTARILKGAEVVEAMNAGLRQEVERLRKHAVRPCLAIVRVGEQADDISYERAVTRQAEKLGIVVKQVPFPQTVSQASLVDKIERLNQDASVHGVLLFRPLPPHLDEDSVRNSLKPEKDIDGITDLSLMGVFAGAKTGYAPCTAQACLEILQHYGEDLEGKKAVVVGRSLVVGKPVAMMLLERNATVTIAHSRTENLPQVVSQADIVVACVGRAQMLDAAYLSSGQVILDVGINVDDEGKLVGDVAFEDADAIVGAITPVPGGVGTVTTSTLLKHVVEAAMKERG